MTKPKGLKSIIVEELPMPASFVCSHSKKECEQIEWLAGCMRIVERKINRAVLIGAIIGSGLGSTAAKYLSSLF
jgi:hypothetical protein